MNTPYLSETEAPTPAEVRSWSDCVVLEFGTDWCGHCRAAQSPIQTALAQNPAWCHVKVEDGPGRALGRSYRVKLWPTLILLKNGQEVERLVRPTDVVTLHEALARVHSST